ncbi:YcbK family protein [Pseudahrensia aquimaris]|uniref:Murein endopeptidase K n=1 Tax=Pseudahrensia aquimaris TaxID=744461 RepID=A0ABW3FF85_9HYPH
MALALVLGGCVAAQNGDGADITAGLAPDTNSNVTETSNEAATPKADVPNPDDAATTALAPSSKAKPAAAATEAAATSNASSEDEPPKSLFAALSQANGAKPATKTSTRRPKAPISQNSSRKRVIVRRKGEPNGLPGVRKKTTIFGIVTDETGNEDLDEPVEVASLPSQTRRGNFGLKLQTASVRVHCFPRELVRILKRVERKFGRTPVVTSGYRSPAKNRRVRGARNSVHLTCKAADIQVPGVSKWTLARYLRRVPGRGGVGTYCHTNSVHIDVGKKRDWNWRCRRKRRS